MRQSVKLRRLTATALLLALVFLLGLTPLGLIPLGFINVTVLCLPVLIGTLLLGLRTGLLLGFAFGSASLMSMLGLSMTPPSLLASTLLGANPLLAVIMCYLPRLLLPVVGHTAYRALVRYGRQTVAPAVAAAAGSLTNTVFYLGLMLLFYHMSGLDDTSLRTVIAGTGLVAGGSEAAVAALLVPPVLFALRKLKMGWEEPS